MLKYVNEGNFEKEVLQNEKVILVDFYADWCMPCQRIAPVLEEMAKENDKFDIAKVNTEVDQMLAIKYGVMSIPTLIIFKGGKIVQTIMGFSKSKEQMVELLNNLSEN